MMRWLVCSLLVSAAGCAMDSDPDADIKPLSQLPAPKIGLWLEANPRTLHATVQIDPFAVRSCARLDDDFHAEVAGAQLTIAQHGESVGSIYSSSPCDWPELALRDPPPVDGATLTITYGGKTITAGLADLLVPRTAVPVPEGPWAFGSGQRITVAWAPISDLAKYLPQIRFVPTSPGQGEAIDLRPISVIRDLMTFTLPVGRSGGVLEMTVSNGPFTMAPLLCTGATCQVSQRVQIQQPITLQ
jgi:hypothetical protein